MMLMMMLLFMQTMMIRRRQSRRRRSLQRSFLFAKNRVGGGAVGVLVLGVLRVLLLLPRERRRHVVYNTARVVSSLL